MRLIPVLCLALCCCIDKAIAQDTLRVHSTPSGWTVKHSVRKSETLFQLARLYKVPPAILADANQLTYNDGLRENTLITVPIGAYNRQSYAPQKAGTAKALIYVTNNTDDLKSISGRAGVPPKVLQDWNRLNGEPIGAGRKLFVGWMLSDTSGIAPAIVKPAPPLPQVVIAENPLPVEDTTLSPVEIEFARQTSEGKNVVTEKGTVVFFRSSSASANGLYNGFHNTAPRGSIIQVRNINNDKSVYVKVLGPLPASKQYYNAALGLSSAAVSALGAREQRIFCELRYAGY